MVGQFLVFFEKLFLEFAIQSENVRFFIKGRAGISLAKIVRGDWDMAKYEVA